MKNLITLFAFSLFMLVNTESTFGQSLTENTDRPEVIAKTKTSSLNNKLQLSGEQQRSVFRALVAKEVNYRKYIDGKDLSDVKVSADKKKFDDVLTTSMKKILTPEQFKQWKALPKQ